MPNPSPAAAALSAAGLVFECDAPLARRTWWRVGGPADVWVTIETEAQLIALQRAASATNTPVFVLGNGSNILVSDAGERGIVAELAGELAQVEVSPDGTVSVGAGMKLVVLLARARKHGWTGFEAFAGIPGTVGGAVVMNAGSQLGETKDALVSVDLVRADGTVETWTRAQLEMSYRTCHLPKGAIVARAHLRPTGGDAAESETKVADFLAKRKATQPLDLPSCGSTFRNPPGDTAGRLIEAAGLKGYQVGGAQVSLKHANFVVNLGEATAVDIRAVIEHVAKTVLERFGVSLEREVHYVGESDV